VAPRVDGGSLVNLLRPIEVAPGITVSVKDLDRTDVEFIATHHLAGNAIIRRCTHSGPGISGVIEYWSIETCFHGEDPVEPVRGSDLAWTTGAEFTDLDQVLMGLSVLAAQWVAERPLLAHQRGMRGLS